MGKALLPSWSRLALLGTLLVAAYADFNVTLPPPPPLEPDSPNSPPFPPNMPNAVAWMKPPAYISAGNSNQFFVTNSTDISPTGQQALTLLEFIPPTAAEAPMGFLNSLSVSFQGAFAGSPEQAQRVTLTLTQGGNVIGNGSLPSYLILNARRAREMLNVASFAALTESLGGYPFSGSFRLTKVPVNAGTISFALTSPDCAIKGIKVSASLQWSNDASPPPRPNSPPPSPAPPPPPSPAPPAPESIFMTATTPMTYSVSSSYARFDLASTHGVSFPVLKFQLPYPFPGVNPDVRISLTGFWAGATEESFSRLTFSTGDGPDASIAVDSMIPASQAGSALPFIQGTDVLIPRAGAAVVKPGSYVTVSIATDHVTITRLQFTIAITWRTPEPPSPLPPPPTVVAGTTTAPPTPVSNPPSPTSQSPSPNVTKSPPPKAVKKHPPPKVTTKSPPPKVTTKSPPPKVTTKSPPPKVTTKSPPPKVAAKSPPPKVTTKSPPPKVTTKSPPPKSA